jgi:hypothetical protein
MLRQPGVLHDNINLEMTVTIDQAMDDAGSEPNDGPGAQRRLSISLTAERLYGTLAGEDEISLGASKVQVRTAAGQSVWAGKVVYPKMSDANSAR